MPETFHRIVSQCRALLRDSINRLPPTRSCETLHTRKQRTARAEAARQLSKSHGAAQDYYNDTGQSVVAQPGVRPSISTPIILDKPLPPLPAPIHRSSMALAHEIEPPHGRRQHVPVRRLENVPTNAVPPRTSSHSYEKLPDDALPHRRRPATPTSSPLRLL